jgi:hypothetical protein
MTDASIDVLDHGGEANPRIERQQPQLHRHIEHEQVGFLLELQCRRFQRRERLHTVSVVIERVGGPGVRGCEIQLDIGVAFLRTDEGFETGMPPQLISACVLTRLG